MGGKDESVFNTYYGSDVFTGDNSLNNHTTLSGDETSLSL